MWQCLLPEGVVALHDHACVVGLVDGVARGLGEGVGYLIALDGAECPSYNSIQRARAQCYMLALVGAGYTIGKRLRRQGMAARGARGRTAGAGEARTSN